MIIPMLFLMLVTSGQTRDAKDLMELQSLADLCAQYEELSAQLTRDYVAVQRATAQSKKEKDLLPEIKANSNYAKTRVAFKEVVKELGTRACPIDMEEDFPPLL